MVAGRKPARPFDCSISPLMQTRDLVFSIMPAQTTTPRDWPTPSNERLGPLTAPRDQLRQAASCRERQRRRQVHHDSRGAFVDRHAAAGSDGQVRRAAQRLGLIGVAGEMAADWGIVPWEPGEAFAAAEAALASWVEGRGGTEGAEVRAAISQVRLFIETHGDARFEPAEKSEEFRPVTNRAGWRKGTGPTVFGSFPQRPGKRKFAPGSTQDLSLAYLPIEGCCCAATTAFSKSIELKGAHKGHTRSPPRSWEGMPDVSRLGGPASPSCSGYFALRKWRNTRNEA